MEAFDAQIDSVFPDPEQPRKHFGGLEEFAANVKEEGILQAILVRPHPNGIEGNWMIVLGERRWRAAKLAEKNTVPVVVRRDIDDEDAFCFQLIENFNEYRHAHEAYERAVAIKRYVDKHGDKGVEMACKRFGQNKDWISRETALTRVTDEVWKFAEDKKIADKRTILDLHRLCKHTGRRVEDEWANISATGMPKRDAIHARLEASGVTKKRTKVAEASGAPFAPSQSMPSMQLQQPEKTETPAGAPTTFKIELSPNRPSRFKRRGLEEKLRLAGERLGIDPEIDFEALLEALVKPLVPEEISEPEPALA